MIKQLLCYLIPFMKNNVILKYAWLSLVELVIWTIGPSDTKRVYGHVR